VSAAVIPFEVKMPGAPKVKITIESLVWFFIATMAATVAGEVAYYYLQGLLPALPKTNNTVAKAATTAS
jgi:hypothetical protein